MSKLLDFALVFEGQNEENPSIRSGAKGVSMDDALAAFGDGEEGLRCGEAYR